MIINTDSLLVCFKLFFQVVWSCTLTSAKIFMVRVFPNIIEILLVRKFHFHELINRIYLYFFTWCISKCKKICRVNWRKKKPQVLFEKWSLYFLEKVILMEFRFTLQGPFHSLGSGQVVNRSIIQARHSVNFIWVLFASWTRKTHHLNSLISEDNWAHIKVFLDNCLYLRSQLVSAWQWSKFM